MKRLIAVLFAFGLVYFGWTMLSFNQRQFFATLPLSSKANPSKDLIDAASSASLSGQAGSANDDRGYTLHAVSASSKSIRFWAQSLPLSNAQRGADCKMPGETRPDQKQFIIIVESRLPFQKKRVDGAVHSIKEYLIKIGYGVHEEPKFC